MKRQGRNLATSQISYFGLPEKCELRFRCHTHAVNGNVIACCIYFFRLGIAIANE
jgi:hypothetical protein